MGKWICLSRFIRQMYPLKQEKTSKTHNNTRIVQTLQGIEQSLPGIEETLRRIEQSHQVN